MSEYKFCKKGCCKYEVKSYNKNQFTPKPSIKAGVFIFDNDQKKILLVQSRGNLWGSPKGSKEENETVMECALREVKEETGLELESNLINDNCKFIYNNSHYYSLNIPENPVSMDAPMIGNDATGIGWFHINCLIDLIHTEKIKINYHCRLLLEYFLKIRL